MTHTLCLRLSAPLQAWGVQSAYEHRDTIRHPSKSGVVGLLASALGRRRTDSVADLAGLRMGVRVDEPGSLLRDFQTMRYARKANAQHIRPCDFTRLTQHKSSRLGNAISERYYLSDACFLVGLEGTDLALLRTVHAALRDPQWMLHLGRRACPPGEPIWLADGLREGPLIPTLSAYPWLGRRTTWENISTVQVAVESSQGNTLPDAPPTNYARRDFGPRRVMLQYIDRPPRGA